VTAEESWTARELVGGDTIVGQEVAFRPGHLMNAIAENRWLVIDELNRADMDRIFGPIFTWLAGDPARAPEVTLGRRGQGPGEPAIVLAWRPEAACVVEGEESLEGAEDIEVERIAFHAGSSWRLLGTYNAVDAQRVFRLGQALGRRFVRVPIPPLTAAEFSQAASQRGTGMDPDAVSRVGALYQAHLGAAVTTLGPALFLRMLDYMRAAAVLGVDEDEDLIGEAYLVNAGAWLARLDSEDLSELQARASGEKAPLTEEAWNWIKSMLPNLG
jgi:MoxR-like ATPase